MSEKKTREKRVLRARVRQGDNPAKAFEAKIIRAYNQCTPMEGLEERFGGVGIGYRTICSIISAAKERGEINVRSTEIWRVENYNVYDD